MKILLVCLGNICRSPTAHGVLEHRISQSGLRGKVTLDSAGTGGYHIGSSPDSRSIEAAMKRGYDLNPLRARQVAQQDFETFDYILAMDANNLKELRLRCPEEYQHKLQLFLEYSDSGETSVPDPYFGGADGFQHVLTLIEEACDGLVAHILAQHFAEGEVEPPGRSQ
ncbi:MAG: low molecular weight protein-tyrosine-phosphatase [Pseudohongiellaceae bacterium]